MKAKIFCLHRAVPRRIIWLFSALRRHVTKSVQKIVTSKIEHPSVLEAFRKLEIDGFNVEYLDVDSEGRS